MAAEKKDGFLEAPLAVTGTFRCYPQHELCTTELLRLGFHLFGHCCLLRSPRSIQPGTTSWTGDHRLQSAWQRVFPCVRQGARNGPKTGLATTSGLTGRGGAARQVRRRRSCLLHLS